MDQPDKKTREQYLRDELRACHKDMELCRATNKTRDLSTLAIGARKLRDALDAELDRLDEEAGEEGEDITPEELESGMVEDLLSIPADMRRRIIDQVGGVHVLREA